MILESTQILYTALHMNGGTAIIESSAPKCASTGKRGYKKHAAKHPSVIWASASLPHYLWLCRMALCLCDEYMYRWGSLKEHACKEHILWLQQTIPPGLQTKLEWLSDPTPAMPDEYKVPDSVVASYWNYYKGSKQERGLFKWTRRQTPHVFCV